MAELALTSSALAPGVSPVRIHYRESGAGPALLILHGGWGYDIYPFERQIAALSSNHRIVVPDRTGYGGSGRLATQETDFHRRAAAETFAVIEALGLERPVLWGHSDGAVIALMMALDAPERVGGLIVEATHLFRNKPGSREFFETMRDNADGLGERVASVLAREHGDGWRHLLAINGAAWLRIAERGGDLYDGRLPDLRTPVLVIHGARDPRTEPGELEALRVALGLGRTQGSAPTVNGRERMAEASAAAHVGADLCVGPTFAILPEGGHSPHSERATADDVTRIAARYLADLDRQSKTTPGAPVPPAPPARQ